MIASLFRFLFSHRSVSLSQVVRDLCQYWGIEGGSEELFGLRFESSDEYVTETSKKSIKVSSTLYFIVCVQAALVIRGRYVLGKDREY